MQVDGFTPSPNLEDRERALRDFLALDTFSPAAQATIRGLLRASPSTFKDGLIDVTDSLLLMQKIFGYVTLDADAKYLVTHPVTLTLRPEGGRLVIPAGVEISYYCDSAYDTVMFEGDGSAKSMNGTYSVGWYAGDSFDKKHVFMSRAFRENGTKEVIWPYPKANDPAASYSEAVNATAWKVTDPVIMDDPQNVMKIRQYGALYAATPGMSCVIDFSSYNKTENITWETPVAIDGGNNALDGVRIHAGARIQFMQGGFINRVRRDCINAVADLAVGSGRGLDQLTLGQLNVTDFGRYGVNVEGTATNASYGFDAEFVFCNGVKGLWGTVTSVDGNAGLTGVTIDNNGLNGQPQNFNGHGFPGQVVAVQAQPGGTDDPASNTSPKAKLPGTGAGTGALGTFTFTSGFGSRPTGVTLTSAGKEYILGEKVFITSAEAVIRWAGAMRYPKLHRLLENQDATSNLVSVYLTYLLIEATAAGSVRGYLAANIESIQGRRSAVISRNKGAVAANKHSGVIRGWAIANPLPGVAPLHQIEAGWQDDVKFYDGPASPPNTRVINVDRNDTVNARFHSIPREHVSGNGENYFFNGNRTIYTAGLANDEVIETAASLANVGITLGALEVQSAVAGIYYRGQITIIGGVPTWVDLDKPAAVETRIGQLVSGNTGDPAVDGTAGKFILFLYLSNGNLRLGIKNRFGSSVRFKAPIYI